MQHCQMRKFLIENVTEKEKKNKRDLIAGATVIVPDREVRDRFWHLQVRV